MGWIILCIIVLAATAIWPLGRWTLKDGAEPGITGFWVSLTIALVCAAGTLATGEWRGAPAGVWVAAAVWIGWWTRKRLPGSRWIEVEANLETLPAAVARPQ